jgi:hypothetical protein
LSARAATLPLGVMLAGGFVGLLAGCFGQLPDSGLYRCDGDGDCPADYQCRDRRCWTPQALPMTCTNGSRDPDESDVDCGGSGGCARCDLDRACAADRDCATGSCVDVRCELVSSPPYWLTAPPLHLVRQRAAVVADPDGRLFALGGTDGNNPFLDTVEVLDTAGGIAWTNFDKMQLARRSAAGAVLNGDLFVAGGFGNPTLLESYDFNAMHWTTLSNNIGFNLADAGYLSDGKQLAIFGGVDGNGFVNGTAHLYAASGDWTSLPPILPRRALGAAIGADGRWYALGGAAGNDNAHDTDRVQAFTLSPPAWSEAEPLPVPIHNLGAVGAPDGRIYIIGGTVANTAVGDVYAYRPGAGARWLGVASLAAPRTGAGAVLGHDGRIYAVGGGKRDDIAVADVEAYGPVVMTAEPKTAVGGTPRVAGQNFARSADVEVHAGVGVAGQLVGRGKTNDSGSLDFIDLPAQPTAGDVPFTVVDSRSRYPVTIYVHIQ